MNQVTEEQKGSLTKTFAIVGFIAIVVFAVWLAVQIVSVIPSAFSSLASLADSVYNYDSKKELVVSTKETVINAGESFSISWTTFKQDGIYTFSYACTEGVSVDAKSATGEIVSVACNTPLDLGNTSSLEVLIASEKFRFVDIPYTVTFTQKGVQDSTVTTTKTITIVNATIPTSANLADGEAVNEDPKPVETPVITTPVKTPTYVAGKPTTIKKVTYSVPVSNPNGKIDLQVTYIGVGTLNGKTFTPSKSIDIDDEGALQFEVKNIGTKTADSWSYKAELPSDITYTSGDQKALKPNERAIITLGFEGIAKTGSETVGVTVTAKNDVAKTNNDFTKTIKIVD